MSQGWHQNYDLAQVFSQEQSSHEDGNVDPQERQASGQVQRQSQFPTQTAQQPPCIIHTQLQTNPIPPSHSSTQPVYPHPNSLLYPGNSSEQNQAQRSTECVGSQPLNRSTASASLNNFHYPLQGQFLLPPQEYAEPTYPSGQRSIRNTATDLQQHRFQTENSRNVFTSPDGTAIVPAREDRMAPQPSAAATEPQGSYNEQPYNPQMFGYYSDCIPTNQYPPAAGNFVNTPFDREMKDLPNTVVLDNLGIDGENPSYLPSSTQQNDISKLRVEERNQNQCLHCRKKFRRPSSLQTHMYTHTGEKPFQCRWPQCGRRFSVRSNMVRHFRLHKKTPTQRSTGKSSND